MDPVSPALVVVGAYLLGSMPTGYLVARARKVDIRTVGSGNIGATNVFRVLGNQAGTFVLVTDFLKGLLACILLPRVADWITQAPPGVAPAESLEILAGIGAVLGHNYTCWLRFKGGKGIATSAGVLVALVPKAVPILLLVWIAVFVARRYVSLASISAALALPPAAWLTGSSRTLLVVAAGLMLLAVYKHRPNIGRLLKGTEPRVVWPRRSSDA